MERSFAPRVPRPADRLEGHADAPPQVRRRRLVVGRAGDPAEAEADRVAAEVMRDLASTLAPDREVPIPRSIAPDAVGREGGPLEAEVETRIQQSRGHGSPLPAPVRRSMEESFGADFGRIRLHTGPSSDELNRSMQSRAFTVGGDVYFARNQYQPDSGAGRELLAHELAHTIQQSAASPSTYVRRALVDVASLDATFQRDFATSKALTEAMPTRIALRNYRDFIATALPAPKWQQGVSPGRRNAALGAHRTAGGSGGAFYDRTRALLEAVRIQADNLIKSQRSKKADTYWLETLVEKDIPQTVGWAARIRDDYATYAGMTGAQALQTIRSTALTDYAERAFPTVWSPTRTQVAGDLLVRSRDKDAARLALVRDTAKKMLDRGTSPQKILGYMAAEAKKFVEFVVTDYVETMGLEQQPFVVVTAGSFVGGELYPFSDLDIELMKAGMDVNDPAQMAQMKEMLESIKLRVHLASMKEFGGEWSATKGWDFDQLGTAGGGGFTAATAKAGDPAFGLANAKTLLAFGGGESEADALRQLYESGRLANAQELMNGVLHPSVFQSKLWQAADDNRLAEGGNPFDFKERYMRMSKVLLNVLAMLYDLRTDNSWTRIDELVKRKKMPSALGSRFKTYLDLTAKVRMRYQFFYELEDKDRVTPTASKQPEGLVVNDYPKGYYVLTAEDRQMLKRAGVIQASLRTAIKETKINIDQLVSGATQKPGRVTGKDAGQAA